MLYRCYTVSSRSNKRPNKTEDKTGRGRTLDTKKEPGPSSFREKEMIERITREFAEYTVTEHDPTAFSVSYTLIKNVKRWGTVHHVYKGATILWVPCEGSSGENGFYVFPSRADIDKIINANEARLAKKAAKNKEVA